MPRPLCAHIERLSRGSSTRHKAATARCARLVTCGAVGYRVAVMSEMSALLTAKQAAVVAGVSERTVRRWLRSGQVRAVKKAGAYRIHREALAAIVGQNGHEPADTGADTTVTAAAASELSAGVAELTRLVREQQATILELAGRVGYYQAENAQFRERLALMAPEPTSTAEATPTPATRRWWRFWD